MKKRILALSLALILALLLCACSKKPPEPYTTALADELLDSAIFEGSQMAPLPELTLPILYGIDRDSIVEARAYMAVNTSVSADELAILVLKDEDAAIAATDALRARVALQITVCESYTPAAVPRLEHATISRRENTVLYIVGDPDAVADMKLN